MDEELPDWITNDFLTQVLRKEEGHENVIVKHFTATLALPAGNNFGSTIIQLKVEYVLWHQDDMKSISLILKAEKTGPLKEIFDLSAGEPIFYFKFIPEAKRLMDMSFVPKAYVSPRLNDIILEDLKEQRFLMTDRTKQLDYDHCRLYMAAAAKLHAVSVAVFKQNPDLITAFGEEKIFSNKPEMANIFKSCIKFALEILAEETNKIDKFKKHSKTIKESMPFLYNMILESHKPHEGLKTINQGDPWTTNMMFKYDEQGKVSDIKLLDFQCLRYASPANDIVFFIWTSANNTVKKYYLDKLYDVYLNTFNDTLELLNCPEKLTRQEFMESVKLLSPEALYWAGCPTVRSPDPVDFEMFLRYQANGNGGELIRFFRDKVYNLESVNQLPDLLESLDKSGVFDYLEKAVSDVKNV